MNNILIEQLYTEISETDPTIFSTALRLLRKIKGYTQKEIAEKIDVDKTTISKWETNQAFPRKKTFKKLITTI